MDRKLVYGNCNDVIKDGCPIEYVLKTFGGKWKGIIIDTLSRSSRYYNNLHRDISGISRKVLTEQLSELEKQDIIFRHETDDYPKRVLYSLTDKGYEIYSLICKINDLL